MSIDSRMVSSIEDRLGNKAKKGWMLPYYYKKEKLSKLSTPRTR
jgi:hypothetical protein